MVTQSRFRCRLVLAAFLVSGWSATALAQADKKADANANSVNVKIIERTDLGEVRELERSYKLDGLKDDERDALVNRLVDSLRAKRGNRNGQVTIIVDDTNGSTSSIRLRERSNGLNRNRPARPNDLTARRPHAPARPNAPLEFRYYRDGKLQNQYRFNPDSLADRLERSDLFRWPEAIGQRMDDAFRNWSWSTDGESPRSSTVHSLQAYPNNPETNQLNLRFTAPTKGDVRIRVTTPDGKEVARKEVKDFSGSYVGQIDLDKKAKGVYFIHVTQNEDGAVKRVVIP